MTQIANFKGFGSLAGWLAAVYAFWFDRIIDPKGGYFEELDNQSEPVRNPNHTLYVQARVLNAACYAYQLTNQPHYKDAADHGFKWLLFSSAGEGWFHTYSTEGKIVDPVRDLYDHAFLLSALARFHSISGASGAIHMAQNAMEFLNARLHDPKHGGFFEQWDPADQTGVKLPRRHNPHMHLLEAFMALFAATKNQLWAEEAAKIVELFRTKFIDRSTGAVVEFFDGKWGPDFPGDRRAPDGQTVPRQPGHHFEWARLLMECSTLVTGVGLLSLAEGLFDFALQNGIEKSTLLRGLPFDGLDTKGALHKESKSFWQALELLALLAARREMLDDQAVIPLASQVLVSIKNGFLREDGVTWNPQVDRLGEPMGNGTSPARLLHHVSALHKAFLAFG